jgi:hypothetical protein
MSEQQQVRARNRNWLWVFVVLAILGVLAISINWAYNAAQPLTEEQLQTARQLWRAKRPANYDLRIDTATQAGGWVIRDRIDLQVREGVIVQFLHNGREPEPLLDREGRRNVEEERRQRASYDVEGLFDAVEEFLKNDRRSGIPSFLRARFDAQDGHLTLFIRQVNRTRSPMIRVELKRVGD